jgi:putative phosphonate metabolism protein
LQNRHRTDIELGEDLISMGDPRYAIYFTPPPGSPLARFGAGVLGYDCDTGEEAARPALPGIAAADLAAGTSEPRRYGFHATLVAPFHLAEERSERDLAAALASFAHGHKLAALGRLIMGLIGGFVALKPSNADVVALAGECVTAFHAFRAPLTATDRERRLAAGLTARQAAYLERWGYPYVLDEFRFHMTLAGPLPAAQREHWRAALAALFAGQADAPALVDAVSLVRQDDHGSRFRVVRREPLRG